MKAMTFAEWWESDAAVAYRHAEERMQAECSWEAAVRATIAVVQRASDDGYGGGDTLAIIARIAVLLPSPATPASLLTCDVIEHEALRLFGRPVIVGIDRAWGTDGEEHARLTLRALGDVAQPFGFRHVVPGVANQREVHVSIRVEDLALSLNDFVERVLKPALTLLHSVLS